MAKPNNTEVHTVSVMILLKECLVCELLSHLCGFAQATHT